MGILCGVECDVIKDPMFEENKPKVFICGGGSSDNVGFYKDAEAVGEYLAKKGAAYIQGGCINPTSVMGASFYGYKNNGGKNSYFIMRRVGKPDISSEIDNITGVYDVDDINDLCKIQFLWSDILVIFPGGTGTISELTAHLEQMWDYEYTKKQKIILYNKKLDNGNGFFDSILEQFKISAKCGFNSDTIVSKSIDYIVDNLDDLISILDKLIDEISKKEM